MKKTLVILNLVLLSLFISGCGCSKKEETVTCKLKIENDIYNMNGEYIIRYNKGDGTVLSYNENEVVELKTENDLEPLSSLKEFSDDRYSELKELEYFNVDTKIQNNKIINKVIINFDKINKEQLLDIDYSYSIYMLDDKFYYQNFVDEILNLNGECS